MVRYGVVDTLCVNESLFVKAEIVCFTEFMESRIDSESLMVFMCSERLWNVHHLTKYIWLNCADKIRSSMLEISHNKWNKRRILFF